MTIRKTNDTLSHNCPIGVTANSISFSNDSKFTAYKAAFKDSEVKAAKKTNKLVRYEKTLGSTGF